MDSSTVKDYTIPLNEYAVVSREATLKEALQTLMASQAQLPEGRPPHRAVLVADPQGEIVGRLGQHGFLEALEPTYKVLGDIEHLPQAGLSEEFVQTITENYRFWQDDFKDVSRRACTVQVKQVMRPAEERIGENASLNEAIHLFVMTRTQSILVTRREKVVGILRLSDLFAEVAKLVARTNCH